MSAAGSKRVNVVQRKFIVLRRGARRLVGEDHERPAGERRVGAKRAAAPGSSANGGAADHEPAAAEDAHVAGSAGGGALRAELPRQLAHLSPRPSHTPFDPSLTAGPV